MGHHRDDDLDERPHNNDYFADDYFPSGQSSTAGLFSSLADTPGYEFQAPNLNNLPRFDASGSQYHHGAQTSLSTGSLFANGTEDYLSSQIAQPSNGFAQDFPRTDYPSGSVLNAGPLLGSSSPRTPAMPDRGTSYRRHVALEPAFGKGAGSHNDNTQWHWGANLIASNSTSCDTPVRVLANVPIHKRPSVSITSPYPTPIPTVPSDDSQVSFNLDQPSDAAHPKRLLACPFHKHNSRKHNRRTCCGPGFTSISRLKEHLYRRHSEPRNTCPRCLVSFETSDMLRGHQRKRPCEVRPEGDHPDWVTAAQESELRSKKRTKDSQTDEEKWRRIYGILFGWDEDCIPSPYYENEDAESEEYYHIPRRKVHELRAHNPPLELKFQFESDVGRVLGFASGPQLEKISDLACDLAAKFIERSAL
ncbi:hypothetical protein QBC34DRAFT_414917 [Podospora aff. communis PSN243]|uniref:C2H2-type domain-containing protein n=1 Tax=Podospora aff. communis PSN243 TaxID=3040156 RepID=A0AAV9G8W1_9PEZI|nr:hypothetical protein QBC34DRAFT_414917 [Podospora aff. communis PSN243]